MTIITGWNDAVNRLSSLVGPILSIIWVGLNMFAIPFSLIVIIVSIIGYLTQKYRADIGTHGIPCSVLSLYRFKIANRHNKLLKSIHKDIYHSFYKLKDDMHMRRIQNIDDANKGLEDLLYFIHTALLKSFNLDLTISVKRLILDKKNNLCLVPFKHFRSIAERKMTNPRDFNYCYYIDLGEYEKTTRYTAKARQYCESHGNNREYEINSIFTYLITQRKRYWMSNDLTIDEKNDVFYTSSDNYIEFYNSMAAFSIAPPNKSVLPEGLLIFDTRKTGVFSEEECVNLFGYIAHLFYELLIEYSNYESKKK